MFCLVSCSSKNQVPYFKAVTDSNLTRLLLRKKKKKKSLKKTAFRSALPICHELWDIAFIFFSLSKNNVNLILVSRKIIVGNVFFKIRLKESIIGSIFILKLANFWNLWFFQNWSKFKFLMKNKNKHNSRCIRPILMQFSIFIWILHSPKTETY